MLHDLSPPDNRICWRNSATDSPSGKRLVNTGRSWVVNTGRLWVVNTKRLWVVKYTPVNDSLPHSVFGGIWVLHGLGGRRTVVARRGDQVKHRMNLVLEAKAHRGMHGGAGGGGAILVRCEAGAAVDPSGERAGDQGTGAGRVAGGW